MHRYFAQTLSSAGPSGGRHRISLLTRGIAIDSTESVFTMVQFYKIYYILYFECALMDGRKNEGTTVDGILVPIAQITTFHLVLLVVYGLVSVHLPVSSYLSGCISQLCCIALTPQRKQETTSRSSRNLWALPCPLVHSASSAPYPITGQIGRDGRKR